MTGSPGRPLVLVIEDDLRYVRQLRADLELCDCEAVISGTGAGWPVPVRQRARPMWCCWTWDCLTLTR